MRILVHEFVSGGGLAGRPLPASLVGGGRAMRDALVADLAAIGTHEITATVDRRVPLDPVRGVHLMELRRADDGSFAGVVRGSDAVWLIAPETDGCLERLATEVRRCGTTLLGSCATTVRRAADKATLARHLARAGIPHPATRLVWTRPGAETSWYAAAGDLGLPVVVKPVRSAGCIGVALATDRRDLDRRLAAARRDREEKMLLQRFVPGTPVSVSLLASRGQARALSVNAQSVRGTVARPEDSRSVRLSKTFSYRGGMTPVGHRLAGRATEVAAAACALIRGLRGYVGVDLVLTDSEAFVIEVNPRLTMSYLGLRMAIDENVAEMALAACAGSLSAPASVKRCVHFTETGRITSAVRLTSSVPVDRDTRRSA